MTDLSNDLLLQRLEEHEMAIASLYEAFVRCLPDAASFWNPLVAEEKAHAAWLRALRQKLASEGGLPASKKFNAAAVQTSIDYVKRIIARTASEPFTTMKALVFAIDLEKSMIENGYFRILPSDADAMRQLFQALETQTVTHLQRMEDQLSAERAKRAT